MPAGQIIRPLTTPDTGTIAATAIASRLLLSALVAVAVAASVTVTEG